MQDFRNYSYVIQINDLERTVKEAIEGGYSAFVVINGEYYDVDVDGSKFEDWRRNRKGR